MKNIGTVNFDLPEVGEYIEYLSDSSLRDYDIIVIDPTFPDLSRIQFGGGGSCVDIEDGTQLTKAITHWKGEIHDALKAGKAIFCILSSSVDDAIAVGYTTPRKGHRTYSTHTANNYMLLPTAVDLRNAKGRRIKIADAHYRELYQAISGVAEYKVIINSPLAKKVYLTNDGSGAVGGVVQIDGLPGHLVLVPYFNLSEMVEDGDDGAVWTAEAIKISKRVASQLIAIDKALRSEGDETPAPAWAESVRQPAGVAKIDRAIAKIDTEISGLEKAKEKRTAEKADLQRYQALLYENGKILEEAIESSLKLLGYKVENYRNYDLEIDHIIVGPSGLRLIGESEGKDNSAIDITKFRQLESNINEDFARDEVDSPAKGILFGNGYRLAEPSNAKMNLRTSA
jgi:hypothetical protein